MTLDPDDRFETSQGLTREDLEQEYRNLLSYQKTEELRTSAQRWGVQIRATRKKAIVNQLAAWLSDPQVIRAQLDDLDDLEMQVLTYLHLILAPDYGVSADNIVRGMVWQRERVHQQTKGADALFADALPADTLPADTPILPGTIEAAQTPEERNTATQERIVTLHQRGLLLAFRQGNTVYYSLPTAVRLCLPARPELFAGRDQADSSRGAACAAWSTPATIRETTIGRHIQALYAVWVALTAGLSGAGRPISRQALPPRHPIEDTWAVLQNWNNDPDEISQIAAGRYGRGRTGASRLDPFSAGAPNWALTVSAPPRRLSDNDLAFVHQRTGCSAPEVDFCYALLEAIGALSGGPGQPVSIHKEAMYRFLRAPFTNKVRTLWHAWTTSATWSEMDAVLRAAMPDSLRLRRSLAYPDFTPADLYAEWRDARQAVLRFLALLGEEQWVSTTGFLRAVYSVHPDLLHNRTDSSLWRLESPKTGKQFGATIDDWQQSHGRFVLAMLQGPLYWLGLVRLGYSSAESPVPEAFQLTPAGAFALGRRAEPPARALDARPTPVPEGADTATCSVTDDLTITLLPGRAPAELYDLVHLIGSLVEATPERFVYRLTASGVLRWAEAVACRGADTGGADTGGADTGGADTRSEAIETLIAALSKHCAPPGAQPQVAAAWQRKLRTWDRNYGQLHVYDDLTLIELADDYALQELLVSTSLREHLIHQFSPRLVAIRDGAVQELVQEMEKRGYTPRVK